MMSNPQIDSNFPGGNIIVEKIEGDTVTLRPDLRDTEGHWFYWNFRIQGAEGRRLRFVFRGGPCIGARGPAVSRDDGATWQWLEVSELPDTEAFDYNFGPQENNLRFAFCIPYPLGLWESFAGKLPSAFEPMGLTQSRRGCSVPMVQVGGSTTQPMVILTARHHCCETSANYVLEGLMLSWKASADIGLTVIPFMDPDGVEAGDQGKNRRPHDHNRDYAGEGLYSETRALRRLIEQHHGPLIVLDLHCPYLRKGDSETVYLVGSAQPEMAEKQTQFSGQLEQHVRGLPYHRKNDIPFGTLWNVAANFRQGKSFAAWAEEQPHCRLSTTIEIPYANAEGVAVTPESCREFGASLAEVLNNFDL